MNRILKIFAKALISFIIFFHGKLFAIGLSEIKVNSYLNEPLNATIRVTGAEDLDLASLLVELADSKDFMRAGIPRPSLLSYLKFEIKKAKEELVIQVATNIVIKDPFLDFLLQLTWPEGTLIKNYTVLLDPKPIDQNSFFPNVEPTSDLNNKELHNEVENIHNTDKIFATSIEQSNENELLLNPNMLNTINSTNILGNKNAKLNASQGNKKTTVENTKLIEPNSNNTLLNVDDLNHSHNNQNFNSLLNKLIVNLQNINESPKKNKINYQKLLDLTPEVISLSQEEEKLAEKFAINQIDSELNALRGEKSKKENLNINADAMHSKITEQPNNNVANNTIKDPASKQHNVYYYNADHHNAYNPDFFPKYGNNLLLAFFLASGTMYLFYKLITTAQISIEKEINTSKSDSVSNVNIKKNIAIDKSVIESQNLLLKENFMNDNTNDSLVNSDIIDREINFNHKNNAYNSNNANNINFIRNEELELKMTLATQYMATGDKKSAKELLQEIINVKDQKYKDQITNMLKVLN